MADTITIIDENGFIYTRPSVDSLNGLAPKEMRIPAQRKQPLGQQSVPEYYTRGSTPDNVAKQVEHKIPEPLPRYHREEFDALTMFWIPVLILTIAFTLIWKCLVGYIKKSTK